MFDQSAKIQLVAFFPYEYFFSLSALDQGVVELRWNSCNDLFKRLVALATESGIDEGSAKDNKVTFIVDVSPASNELDRYRYAIQFEDGRCSIAEALHSWDEDRVPHARDRKKLAACYNRHAATGKPAYWSGWRGVRNWDGDDGEPLFRDL
jgi:hypothetical protein